MIHQVEHMKLKAESWANLIRVSGLPRSEVWYSLNSMIMKTLEYPLLATTMSEADLESIMSIILHVGLSKSGICRTITRKAVYSSNKYFGFGIKHLYMTQGLTKLKLFLQPKGQLTQHLIKTAWECCRLESGLGNNFFKYPATKNIKQYVTQSWMLTLWEFLARYKIDLFNLEQDCRRFNGDGFFMAQLIHHNLPKSEIRIFNLCRIYLQVELISDILTADGLKIRPTIWKGERSFECHRWKWPFQPRPDNRAWVIWRRVLRHIFNTTESGNLARRSSPFRLMSQWRWFYSETENRIYEVIKNQSWFWSIIRSTRRQSRRHNLQFGTRTPTNNIPSDLKLCTVYATGTTIVLESVGSTGQVDHLESDGPLWVSSIQCEQYGPDQAFQDEWRQGNLVLVSDGSSKSPVGTGAWILTSQSLYARNIFMEGSAISPGPASAQDSHRAECIGILGGL
jgi:hypothetical protein